MIQCYYGNGKGKTTSAIGSVIRCVGCGQKVLFVGFLKDIDSAEFKVLESLESVDLLFSDEHYNLFDNYKPELTPKFKKAYTTLLFGETKTIAGDYQMIVLDEILDAVEFGYIEKRDFIKLLGEWNFGGEVILTGHKLPDDILRLCSYVSEVREVIHPYTKGISSRKGIEF